MHYRLFFFAVDGKHIEGVHEFEAQDDEEAITISAGCDDGRPMELWQRDRRVKRWD